MRILGIDGGIASIGWAVIERIEAGAVSLEGSIVAAGVRTFEPPETAKERMPKNQLRRQFRGQRRVIRRRRQRMNAVRELFAAHGLLPSADKNALAVPGADPWTLRAAGLDRLLTPIEWALALGHIARHRGFRSNAKRDREANAAADSSKMLRAIEASRERLARYRTIGELVALDPGYTDRKRNRSGDYSRSVLRDDQAEEVRTLFAKQRLWGSSVASEALEAAFADIAFSQRPIQSSEDRVGFCPFEPGERRSARRSPSFEFFRFLARLNALRLMEEGGERRLTPEEIATAAAGFGTTAKVTFKSLRKALGLHHGTRFAGLRPEDESRDVVARTGNAAEGLAALRKAVTSGVGEVEWGALRANPVALDQIAFVLTFRNEPDDIRAGIEATGVSREVVEALMAGLDEGRFSSFSGAGHISAKAARAMIPGLLSGLAYSEAAASAGYDHSARPTTSVADIGSPVARKALSEMLKQVKTLVHELGPFDRIHVELARDVGKSAEERGRIERGIEV